MQNANDHRHIVKNLTSVMIILDLFINLANNKIRQIFNKESWYNTYNYCFVFYLCYNA